MGKVRKPLGDGSGRTVLENGSTVGGYLLTFLAAGGQGVVYRGEKLGRTVVLKEVEASNTRETPALISEKSLLERLSHPGLLKFHSLLNEDGYFYLVVEHVDGRPLSDLLDPSDLPSVEDVADWAVQLCDIFDYLHSQRPPIIFRDLKPENVLLGSNGRVKLIDFGIARLYKGGDRQQDTHMMGSRVTASPEHYGGSETDARSDIFTLGATVHDLLTGGARRQTGAFEFAPVRETRPEVPVGLEAALVKATSFKPFERFSSAGEFANAILLAMGKPARKFATREGTPGGRRAPESGGDNSDKGGKGSKSKKLLLALALLLVLGAAGVSQSGLLDPPAPVSEYPPSTGVQEVSLKGDLFGSGKVGSSEVVFMGEDIGLFEVTAWEGETAPVRAKTLADRLNRFYQSACLACGGSNLESPDIRVGRYSSTGDLVVFYAHIHGNAAPAHGPLVLATVDAEQAKALGQPVEEVAYYWRDIVRDILSLSRGFPVNHSALGEELAAALGKARGQMRPQGDSVENLRRILAQTTGKESLKFREQFLKIPARPITPDSFVNVQGYEPLKTALADPQKTTPEDATKAAPQGALPSPTPSP